MLQSIQAATVGPLTRRCNDPVNKTLGREKKLHKKVLEVIFYSYYLEFDGFSLFLRIQNPSLFMDKLQQIPFAVCL